MHWLQISVSINKRGKLITMTSFISQYFDFLKKLLTAMIMLLIIPVLLQIISRFIPFVPRYIWTEEVARFAFIWIIMIGASIAVREQTHFKVDVLKRFSQKWENRLTLALLIFMLLFAIAFVIGGYQFALFGSTQQSEISGLPMLAIYIAWPLAGLSWILFIVEQIHQHFSAQKNNQ